MDSFTHRQLQELSPSILSALILFLDTVNAMENLTDILDILKCLAKYHSNTFINQFQDIIDLLVGWYLDPTISNNDRKAISDAFISYEPFWESKYSFGFELLQHFLTDIYQRIQQKDGHDLFHLLLGCFDSLLQSISPLIVNLNTNGLQYQIILTAFNQLRTNTLLLFIDILENHQGSFKDYKKWILQANNIVFSMIKVHPISFQTLQYSFFDYITKQNQYNYISAEIYITYLLKLVCISLPSDQLRQLLLDVNSSPLYTLITDDNNNIKQGVFLLLQYVIQTTAHTSKALLYDTSNQWLSLIQPYEIKTTISIMKKITNRTKSRAYSFDEPTFNPLDESKLKLEWNDYNHSLWRKWNELKIDGQYKHQSENSKDGTENNYTVDNIEPETNTHIQMNPLIYCQLLLIYLKTPSIPCDLKQRHVYRIAHLLHFLWQKGEFQLFQHILHILLNSWSAICSISDLENDIVQSSILHDIIDCWLQLTLYTKNDLLKYFNELISSATILNNNNNNNNNNKVLSFSSLILKLLNIEGYEKNWQVKEKIVNLVRDYWQLHGSSNEIDFILHHTKKLSVSSNVSVKEVSIKLLCELNPFMISEVSDHPDELITSLKSLIMTTPHTGMFRPIHYELVMKQLGLDEYLINNNATSDNEKNENIMFSYHHNNSNGNNIVGPLDWAKRILNYCDGVNQLIKINNKNMDENYIENTMNGSISLLYYWSIWEISRYCILSRLRTPFGGPQQTFAAFEKTLHSFLNVKNTSVQQQLQYQRSLSITLLLLDRLEIQIYHASSSDPANNTTNPLPNVPKPSFTFFSTNRKTCQDYFTRIRPLMIQSAKIVRLDTLALKHTFSYLSFAETQLNTITSLDTLVTWYKNLNVYVKDMVELCIGHKLVDSIVGLEIWYQGLLKKAPKSILEKFENDYHFINWIGPLPKSENDEIIYIAGRNSSWFQVAARFAMGYNEEAIELLSQYSIVDDLYGILEMLHGQVINFYTSLEDYSSIQKVCKQYPNLLSTEITHSLVNFTTNNKDKFSHANSNKLAEFINTYTSLDKCVQLNRLTKFRHCTMDKKDNHKFTNVLKDRLLLSVVEDFVFNDGYHNQTNLIELQIIHQQPLKLQRSAEGWLDTIKNRELNIQYSIPDTIHWLRLANSSTEKYPMIQLQVAKVARRQCNYKTAMIFLDACQTYQETKDLAVFEKIKLKDDQHKTSEAIIDLDQFIGQNENNFDGKNENQLIIDSYLTLAHLLQKKLHYSEPLSEPLELSYIKECGYNDNIIDKTFADPEIFYFQRAIEIALKKSIEVPSISPKPWFSYATYHYRQALSIFDEKTTASNFDNHTTSSATNKSSATVNDVTDALIRDKSTLMWLDRKWMHILRTHHINLAQDQYQQVRARLLYIFKKYIIEVCSCDDQFSTSNIVLSDTKQDEVIKASELHETIIVEFLKILDILQLNKIEHLKNATVGYFRYLQFIGNNENSSDITDSQQKYHHNYRNNNHSSQTILSTLKLLQILVNYGDALQSIFNEYINNNDKAGIIVMIAWKHITPQLFARLNHPSSFVRNIINHWITQLVDTFPNDIVYDVMVGSSSKKTNKDTKLILQQQANRMMQHGKSDLWISTKRMAEEVEKITVLWEEQWLHHLASLQFEVMTQYEQLDKELALMEHAVDNHFNDFMEIYTNSMKYIITSVEKLVNSTIDSSIIMTPHEQWFNTTFGKLIRRAFELLIKPESRSNYRKGWDKFQQIHKRLAAETQKLRMLDLNNISPYLANWRKVSTNSVIRMPGLSAHQLDQCDTQYINHFGSTVMILPTKTKPKKLDIHSTDGTTYTYLFKGQEDLHLDERIMQLLSTINIVLNEDSEAGLRGLKARTYAVIPMSGHSGMIQWVNNATPLFSFYKNWQKFNHNGKRPTEVYVEKVLGALKQAGLRVTANRRHWPSHILQQIYSEMIKETPRDLLEKFIWYTSCNSSHWLNKSRSLTRSMAVMSIIGYIIGLGDRHLDNILMDDTIGDIIHIDYNVCFEKGASLRVPERVPFRLTQNLVYAMELHSYSGLFKISAEHTLRIMRQHKDLLIGLLDAFIYDPLVDWREQHALHHHENHESHWIELQANLNKVAKALSDTTTTRENQYTVMIDQLTSIKHELQDKQYHLQIILDNSDGEEYEEDDNDEEHERESTKNTKDDENDDDEKKKAMLDRLRENQDNKTIHQQSLANIFKTCQIWKIKHKESLSYLINDRSILNNLINEHYLTTDSLIPFENNLESKINLWMNKRNAIDQLIDQDFKTYYQLAYPVYTKLRQQDTCSIYHHLLANLFQSTNTICSSNVNNNNVNNNNNNSNNNSGNGGISSHNSSNNNDNNMRSSSAIVPLPSNTNIIQNPPSRNIIQNNSNNNNTASAVTAITESSTNSISVSISNQLDSIQTELNRDLLDDIPIIQHISNAIYQFADQLTLYIDFIKKEIYNNQNQPFGSINSASNMNKSVLIHNMKHDVSQLLQYNSHQTNSKLKLVTATEQNLEKQTYLGFSLTEVDNFGWLALSHYFTYLELDKITDNSNIQETLKWSFKSSMALYRFESNCWQFCKKIYDSLFESRSLVEELSFYLDVTTHSSMLSIDYNEHYKNSKPKLWNEIQDIFLPMDMFYIYSKKIDQNQLSDEYSKLKKELITKLLKETIKRFNMIPSDVWTSSLLLSWSLATSISSITKLFINTFLYDIQLPSYLSILTILTPQLSNNPPESIYIGNYSAYLLKLNKTILEDFENQMKQYQVDYHRFQWFNISYLNIGQGFINQITPTMMIRADQITNILSDLHSLNDFILKTSSTDESYWEPLYQQELEKYIFLNSLYSAIIHLENYRKGCQQGIQMEKEILYHLQSIYPNINTTERGTSSSLSVSRLDSTINSSLTTTNLKNHQQKKLDSIPSQLFNTIKHKIKQIISPLEEYYKSSNLLSLLESITMMEIEQNNEMHVAQQSAKEILDTLNYISISQEKLNQEPTFTSYELVDMIQDIMSKLQQFYSSLKVLETFDIDPMQPIDETPSLKNAQQQQNVHVMKIIQRVQEKLEGFDFGSDYAMNINEQVSKTIDQATSARNLSLMYEGWTSWV
ncbi:unnamed protein product [Cunninghamella blakesleeana]